MNIGKKLKELKSGGWFRVIEVIEHYVMTSMARLLDTDNLAHAVSEA